MTIALYMDHHIPEAVTKGLRRRGVDVLTAREDGTARASDEILLARASALGRVLFSQDDDLLGIAATWLSDDRPFAGLVFGAPMRLTIGQAVADLELMAKALDPDDMRNRIEFVPL